MMPEPPALNATQIVGVLVFSTAAAACAFRAWRSRQREALTWTVVALLDALFAFDVVAGLRHRLHDLASQLAKTQGLYATRGTAQAILIVAAAVVLVACAALILKSLAGQSRRARAAACTVAALAAVFATESISLHRIDAILWKPVGHVAFVGWLWVAGALLILCCALLKPARSG